MSSGAIDDSASRSFMWDEFEKMGIDPEKDVNEFNRFQRALYGWADFAEYWFRNPEDEDEPLRLEDPQRKAIDAIQFGYPISDYSWIIPPVSRPKEVIMIWPRQFGKTTAVAVAAACAFIFMQKSFKIGTFSINLDGAEEMMSRIKLFILMSPFKYMVDSQNMTTIRKVGDKVKCTAYPASEGVRGRSIQLGLVDEAAWIPEKIMDGAILKTFRRVGKRWILLSTPAGYKGVFIDHFKIGIKTRPLVCTQCGHTISQDDPLVIAFSKYFTAQDTMFKIPRGLPPCPKCNSLASWVYGVGEYCVVPVDPWNCTWRTREEIEHELDLAGWTPLARQELLGEIIFEGSNVFSMEMLESAVNPHLKNLLKPDPRIRNYVVGMDFGKTHDASVLCVMHYDWDRQKCVFDYMYSMGGEYQDVDYHNIREKFLKIALMYNPLWIVPDATGVGDSVMDEMNRDFIALRKRYPALRTKIFCNKATKGMFSKKNHKGFILDMRTKVDLIQNLVAGYAKRMDMEIPPSNIPEVKEFWDEMLAFSYEITANKNVKYGIQSAHDDRVIAHALSYWVARQRPFVSCPTALGDRIGSFPTEESMEDYVPSYYKSGNAVARSLDTPMDDLYRPEFGYA